jgi:hypothetical protein
MQMEHSVAGLEKNEIFVDDEEIRMEIEGGSILIGEMEELYDQEPYKDGTYTDDKNIVIHLKSFIDNMAITDNMAQNIKRTRREKEGEDDMFTQRMHRFHGILFNRLRGKIKK